MISSVVLGNRIKFFRKNRGLSQLDLESAIDASPGMVSRIENAHVNPTKETMMRIAEVLALTPRKLDYLIGMTQQPASEKEIKRIKSIYDEKYSKRLSYVLDERYRLVGISDEFIKILKISDKEVQDAIGQSFISILIDSRYRIRRNFEEDEYRSMLRNIFFRYYHEVGFMFDDYYFKSSLSSIYDDKIASSIWDEISVQNGNVKNYGDTRKVVFKIGNLKLAMEYSIESMQENNRFELIEYVPKNMLLRLLSKI